MSVLKENVQFSPKSNIDTYQLLPDVLVWEELSAPEQGYWSGVCPLKC